MNIFLFLAIIAVVLCIIEPLLFSGEGLLLYIAAFLTIIMLLAVIPFVDDVNYDSVGLGLKLIVNSETTNEEIKEQIEFLIKSSSKKKTYDFSIDIEDVDTADLLIKKVEVKLKHIVLFKNIYLTDKKTFSILIDKNSDTNNIQVTEVR